MWFTCVGFVSLSSCRDWWVCEWFYSSIAEKFYLMLVLGLLIHNCYMVVVLGDSHCKPSIWGPSLSVYSGSVWGSPVLMLVIYNQHQAGAEEGEGIRPSAEFWDAKKKHSRNRKLNISRNPLRCWGNSLHHQAHAVRFLFFEEFKIFTGLGDECRNLY